MNEYFRLPKSTILYASKGIALSIRDVFEPQPLTPAQQQRVAETVAQGIRHVGKPHVAMTDFRIIHDGPTAHISVNAYPATYPEAHALGRPGEEVPPQARTVGVGTLLIVKNRDGEKRILHTHRDRGNRAYPAFEDVSVNGALEVENLSPGMDLTDAIIQTAQEELLEELGIPEEEKNEFLSTVHIVPIGIGFDERIGKTNITCLAFSETPEEKLLTWQQAARIEGQTENPVETSSSIPATPQAILRMLHSGNPLSAAGTIHYINALGRLVFNDQREKHRGERTSKIIAESWRRTGELIARHNIARLDRRVREFHRRNSHAAKKTPGSFEPWTQGIDPAFEPDVQGIQPKRSRRLKVLQEAVV